MQTKKVKNVAFQKRLTYKVSFDKFTDSSFYGVTNHRFGFIVINTDKSKPMQIYTLIHERIHEIIEKFSRNEIREKLHGLHDLIDYFVSDFKVSYTGFIRFKGFKWYANKIINRYLTERNEDIYNKIQLRLSDFLEFREIVKNYEMAISQFNGYRAKTLKNESKPQNQTDLRRFCEKRNN